METVGEVAEEALSLKTTVLMEIFLLPTMILPVKIMKMRNMELQAPESPLPPFTKGGTSMKLLMNELKNMVLLLPQPMKMQEPLMLSLDRKWLK
ncbi:hypothetical protein FACS1894176_04740 [Bacteroidia bacterium]|nr:hypothetical protein FACS1894176_04740 [Bacteroidia bacterium]